MEVMLDDGALLPTRAHTTDAGLDLYSREDKTIYPYGTVGIGDDDCPRRIGPSETFDTGVHIAFDPGTYGKIESKSGLNVKNSIVSCGGVIDEGYVGSITVKLYNLGTEPYEVRKGDKISQLVIMPYLAPDIEVVDELSDTDRGSNGFGSTGR